LENIGRASYTTQQSTPLPPPTEPTRARYIRKTGKKQSPLNNHLHAQALAHRATTSSPVVCTASLNRHDHAVKPEVICCKLGTINNYAVQSRIAHRASPPYNHVRWVDSAGTACGGYRDMSVRPFQCEQLALKYPAVQCWHSWGGAVAREQGIVSGEYTETR